jgi:hypothetical protein
MPEATRVEPQGAGAEVQRTQTSAAAGPVGRRILVDAVERVAVPP